MIKCFSKLIVHSKVNFDMTDYLNKKYELVYIVLFPSVYVQVRQQGA